MQGPRSRPIRKARRSEIDCKEPCVTIQFAFSGSQIRRSRQCGGAVSAAEWSGCPFGSLRTATSRGKGVCASALTPAPRGTAIHAIFDLRRPEKPITKRPAASTNMAHAERAGAAAVSGTGAARKATRFSAKGTVFTPPLAVARKFTSRTAINVPVAAWLSVPGAKTADPAIWLESRVTAVPEPRVENPPIA